MSADNEEYVRELEGRGFDRAYAVTIATIRERERRARTGKILVKASDLTPSIPFRGNNVSVQYLGYHLSDTATQHWRVFVQDVDHELSGHIHQGGLALFILEGKGATIIDGVRHNWEAGDLLLIPIKPGGVFHQHLNEGAPARWIGFWYDPALAAVATQMIQPADGRDLADVDGFSATGQANE